MDETEERLQLYQYSTVLCCGTCVECPYANKTGITCDITRLQLGLVDGEGFSFVDTSNIKYRDLAHEVGIEEINIALQDYQFHYCLDTSCSNCPYTKEDDDSCSVYRIRNVLRKKLGKSGIATFPYTDLETLDF